MAVEEMNNGSSFGINVDYALMSFLRYSFLEIN